MKLSEIVTTNNLSGLEVPKRYLSNIIKRKICSNCGFVLKKKKEKFCSNCGEFIKWQR